jgi:hypothetical protein
LTLERFLDALAAGSDVVERRHITLHAPELFALGVTNVVVSRYAAPAG